jgi:two-component system cell cycle sensor histidine kinase/response regulator CckA
MTPNNTAGTILDFSNAPNQSMTDQCPELQKQQYTLLFQTNPNPMWVFNIDTLAILAVNDAAISLYGYSRKEFLRLKVTDLRRPEERARLLKAMSAPGEPARFSGEFSHIKKDRSPLTVRIYSSPLVWDGTPARMVTAINITDRRRAERRLREQAEIVDRAQDAIVIRNYKDRRVTFWNKGAERLYGWSAQERLGQADIRTIADQRQIDEIIECLKTTGEFRGEVKQTTKDGKKLITDVNATLVHDEDGKPRSVLIISTDVTEQKRLETQLLRAQRLESIGTLASGVAHDLNNVLTPILICAELLQDRIKDPDAKTTVRLIQDSAGRGAAIVKQVLTFARGVEGARVLIKPGHLIEEMIDIARRTFPKSIEISSRYPEDLWTIEGDPTQLHQVLLNLSVNARDAMPKGGAIVIWAENISVDDNYAAMTPGATPGTYVVICVSDTGSGMSRSTIEKIFDPFFTTKEVGKGTGLGLSTVLGIVKSHGGFVSVFSEVDKGTTFKIFLPATMNAEIYQPADTTPSALLGNGELILIVDDEETILQVTKTVLEEKGYRVLTAQDGPEAVAIFALEMNSLSGVITDISLPLMDGITLIRSLKKIKPSIPFIASTGHNRHFHADQFQELGVKHLLVKPYDTRKLLEVLRDALCHSV